MKKSKFLRLVAVLMTVALLLGMLPATALAEGGNELPIQPVLGFSTTPTTITAQNVPAGFQWHFVGEPEWYTSLVRSGLYPNTEYKIEYISTANSTPTTKIVTTAVADYIKSSGSTSIDSVAAKLPSLSVSHSVDFRSSLNLRFFFGKAAISSYKNVRFFVQREKFNPSTSKIEYESYLFDSSKYIVENSGYGDEYVFAVPGIAAAELCDSVFVTCYAEDATGKTYVSTTDIYSVQKYALNRLSKSSDSLYKQMMVDLLNYGSEAQKYFSYETNRLANASLTADQKALANSISFDSFVNYKNTPTALIAGTNFTGNNLAFNDTCVIQYYFTLGSSYDNSKATVELSYTNIKNEKVSKTFKKSDFIKDGNEYRVDFSDVAFPDMGCKITAVIKNNGTVISNEKYYSIESYCANKSTSNIKDLCLGLMRYSYSARAYFGN